MQISKIIKEATLIPAPIGFCAKTFKVQDKGLYLKISNRRGELAQEAYMLNWLAGKLNVPEVIVYEKSDEEEFLLITELKGIMGYDTYFKDKRELLIDIVIEGLALLQEVKGCTVIRDTDYLIKAAGERVKSNRVKAQYFEKEYASYTPEKLYEKLLYSAPRDFLPVFSHGDYCLPNIIIDGSRLGFIDLSTAGVSDKYNDIGICARSLRYNFGIDFMELFLSKLGVTDFDRINFFILLDEFF